ncbi:MAG: hypothetical protein NZM65_07110 [Flavobacteriales bacterium]|nr:hypothetical protein [Flavobacteriales bacterium]MDW8410442.1 hypothetical protein [Flavobacteriales bacterium]
MILLSLSLGLSILLLALEGMAMLFLVPHFHSVCCSSALIPVWKVGMPVVATTMMIIKIYGFSHTYLSGTGVADCCDILLMPFLGRAQWQPSKYASPFRHETEMAWAGYYTVTLEKHHIRAELSAPAVAECTAIHSTDTVRPPRLLLDLHHYDKVLDSYVTLLSDTEVVGFRRSSFWNPDQQVYFCMRFSSPFQSVEAMNHNKPACR